MATRDGIQGGRELADRFRQIGEQVTREAERALLRGGYQIEADAKRNIVVDSGRLRNSVATRLMNAGTGEAEVQVGSNLVYAESLEFGRSPGSMPPVADLEDWVRRVVLNNTEAYEGEARSVAFAVAKNIEKFGTRPQPFLNPALEENRAEIMRSVQNAIRRELGL